jgi:hypothetical protein
MGIIKSILLQTIELCTLFFGIFGLTFSLLLLFSPNLTKSLSDVFNRQVNLDDKISILDKDIKIDSFIYAHHILFGILLIIGSVFSLIFFFFKLDIPHFANVFFVSSKYNSINEIFFNVVAWIAKIACLVGLVIGFLLLFRPAAMKKIENKVNAWLETRPLFDRLNKSNRNLDAILFKHPIVFGIIGLCISLIIVILSILNMLG